LKLQLQTLNKGISLSIYLLDIKKNH